MNKLHVTFDGTTDTTGYLFSLAKCLSASLRCSGYKEYADDIIVTSGFAFRMWVDGESLCPSAASIWEFKKQKNWIENGGLICEYVERLWDEDAVEEERRLAAVEISKRSIDNGVAPVAWDISGCEWGLIIGYDDVTQTFCTLKIDGNGDSIPYEKLGRLELPILSVVTVVGKSEKSTKQLVADTKQLALSHLRGEEWCENAKGLAAYDALIEFVGSKLSADILSTDTAWNLEYCLGTYAALKWYAWKFFEKYRERELAEAYKNVYEAWKSAFDCKCSCDITEKEVRTRIIGLLKTAENTEKKAMERMSACQERDSDRKTPSV